MNFTLLEFYIFTFITPILLSELTKGVRKLNQFIADVRLRASLKLVVKLLVLLSFSSVFMNLTLCFLLLSLSDHVFFLKLSFWVRKILNDFLELHDSALGNVSSLGLIQLVLECIGLMGELDDVIFVREERIFFLLVHSLVREDLIT
jgi:hypothetical protein